MSYTALHPVENSSPFCMHEYEQASQHGLLLDGPQSCGLDKCWHVLVPVAALACCCNRPGCRILN